MFRQKKGIPPSQHVPRGPHTDSNKKCQKCGLYWPANLRCGHARRTSIMILCNPLRGSSNSGFHFYYPYTSSPDCCIWPMPRNRQCFSRTWLYHIRRCLHPKHAFHINIQYRSTNPRSPRSRRINIRNTSETWGLYKAAYCKCFF